MTEPLRVKVGSVAFLPAMGAGYLINVGFPSLPWLPPRPRYGYPYLSSAPDRRG